MKYVVKKEALEKTTKCRDNFSCLRGRGNCLCEVDYCSNNTVYFIKPLKNEKLCEYKMMFGYSYTCNCPTRKEIHKHYDI